MARSRASAKKAGSAFETVVAAYFAAHLDNRIERRTKSGSKDRGDLSGIRTPVGDRVVAELKDYGGRLIPSTWLTEAAVEAANDDARVGVVVAKRMRKGAAQIGESYVLMDLRTLVILLGGDPND